MSTRRAAGLRAPRQHVLGACVAVVAVGVAALRRVAGFAGVEDPVAAGLRAVTVRVAVAARGAAAVTIGAFLHGSVLAAGGARLDTSGEDVGRARVAVVAVRGTALRRIAGLPGIDGPVSTVGHARPTFRVARHAISALATGSPAAIVSAFAPLAARRAAVCSIVAALAAVVTAARWWVRKRTLRDRLRVSWKATGDREREQAKQHVRSRRPRDTREHDVFTFATGGLVISVHTRTFTSLARQKRAT
jgi:hypothetical protein